MFTKWLKNFGWVNTRVGKGLFEGLLRKFAKHIVDSTSFTKTVKLSIEIRSKMILIGNYTCSRSINEKSHLCLAKYL